MGSPSSPPHQSVSTIKTPQAPKKSSNFLQYDDTRPPPPCLLRVLCGSSQGGDINSATLHSTQADLDRQETLLRDGNKKLEVAEAGDNSQIRSLQATIRRRETQAREASRRRAAEHGAAEQQRRREQQQQQQARTGFGNFYDDDEDCGDPWFPSAEAACAHDGWWAKIQGQTRCPRCYTGWTYLLQCPGCRTMACPRCLTAMRTRGGRGRR
ncbi:hypothetical protein F4778DRAFT_745777 [Xylariomycetidae sp. FL2044]|nr:hypothetical protein F4778DRAFT_745777 [Xylariomycetidae sp. FL2044]